MLRRVIVLAQHTHLIFALSAFEEGAADVQFWERAEVSVWALGGKSSLIAETSKELGTRFGAVVLCGGKAWRDHSHRVGFGQF